MLAITIFSIAMLALGSLMFQASRDMNHSGAIAYRSAAQQSVTAWAMSIPWANIASAIGCTTDTASQLIFNRCTTMQSISTKQKRLTIVISPTGALAARPDTVVIDRVQQLSTSPFN